MKLKNYCLCGIFCSASTFAVAMPTAQALHERIQMLQKHKICDIYEDGLPGAPCVIHLKRYVPDEFFEGYDDVQQQHKCYKALKEYKNTSFSKEQNDQLRAWSIDAPYHFIQLDHILTHLIEVETDQEKLALLNPNINPETLENVIDNVIDQADVSTGICNVVYDDVRANNSEVCYQLPNEQQAKFRAGLKNSYKELVRASKKLRKEVQLVLYFISKGPICFVLGTSDCYRDSECSYSTIRIHGNFFFEKSSGTCCLWLSHANRLFYLKKLGITPDVFDKKAFQHPFLRELLFNEIRPQAYFPSIHMEKRAPDLFRGFHWQCFVPENPFTELSDVQLFGDIYTRMVYGGYNHLVAQWGVIPVIDEKKQLHIFFLEACDNTLFNTICSGGASDHTAAGSIWTADVVAKDVSTPFAKMLIEAAKKWNGLKPSDRALQDYHMLMGFAPQQARPFVNLHPPFSTKFNDDWKFQKRSACENIAPLPDSELPAFISKK